MSGEEALDRAEAEKEALLRKVRANLLDGDVLAWSERCHHHVMMDLDPVRAPVAAQRFGARITLITLPACANG